MGSDSFLDIIANIVGILIILIVIAWTDAVSGAIGASIAFSVGAAAQCAWLAIRANQKITPES